ncbi:LysR family transcriptional regulator [Thiotrichales bacterium 19S3-7]|nr:LysR family transcriptional regulator [Thiotrichales bacterium 19S3-7]MCF6801067.1 LysR family transcriptional regulator [Thiotrichales bacterium 19S3-11]
MLRKTLQLKTMKHQLHHIQAFLKVAQYHSMTKAAQALNLSKAAVSQSIRLLEEAYQVALFVRTTREVTLTEEGKVLYQQAEVLMQQLNTMNDLALNFQADPAGLLRISSNPYFAEANLVAVLECYLAKYPKVDIELYTEERMPDLVKESIDIVIGVNFPAPDEIVRKAIGNTRYILCASPQYLDQHGIPKTIKALEYHNYIPHLGRDETTPLINLKKHQVMPKFMTRLRLNDAHFMKQCALDGLGIIQLHDYVVQKELQAGTLVELLYDEFDERMPLYAYFQRYRFVQPKVRQFINLLEKHLKQKYQS